MLLHSNGAYITLAVDGSCHMCSNASAGSTTSSRLCLSLALQSTLLRLAARNRNCTGTLQYFLRRPSLRARSVLTTVSKLVRYTAWQQGQGRALRAAGTLVWQKVHQQQRWQPWQQQLPDEKQ